MKNIIRVCNLGKKEYMSTYLLQEKLLNLRKKDFIEDTLLLVEHSPPVLTVGRRNTFSDIKLDERTLLEKYDTRVHKINRGGAVTWHGPGQLVGYPIFKLGSKNFPKNIKWFVNRVANIMQKTTNIFGISSSLGNDHEVGIWVDYENETKRKIGFIGLQFSNWCSMHGFSVNVNNELAVFDHIIPCGLENIKVSSIREELKTEISIDEFSQNLIKSLEETLNAKVEIIAEKDLYKEI